MSIHRESIMLKCFHVPTVLRVGFVAFPLNNHNRAKVYIRMIYVQSAVPNSSSSRFLHTTLRQAGCGQDQSIFCSEAQAFRKNNNVGNDISRDMYGERTNASTLQPGSIVGAQRLHKSMSTGRKHFCRSVNDRSKAWRSPCAVACAVRL